MSTQAFNFTGPQPQPPAQGPLAQMALGYGGTGALPAVQQNEYLANALQQLQQSGAEASKTPLALGANLLADALLTYSRHKSNANLLQAVQQGAAGMRGNVLTQAGLAPDGSISAPAPTPAPISGGAPAGEPPAPPPARASAGGNPGLADALAPPSAPPLGGQGAALAAALSPRAALTPDQVTALQSNPTAFLGLPGATITSGARDRAHNAAVGGVPASEHIPGNGYAYDFVPPNGMSQGDALAHIQASGVPYDQLIAEGNHVHVGWRPQGTPGRGQVLGMPQPGPTGPGASPVAGDPLQASAPQPGQGAPAPASQWPADAPAQAALGPAPQGYEAPAGEMNGAGPTQGESAMIQAGLRAPVGSSAYNSALALAQQIAQRRSAPADLEISRPNDVGQVVITNKATGQVVGVRQAPGFVSAAGPKMVMGPNGPQLMPGTGTTQLPPEAPGVTTQRDMTGKVTNEAVPNAVQSGQVWNPQTRSYQPLPGLQPSQGGSFAPGSVVSQEPGKSPTVVQAPQVTPDTVMAAQKDYLGGTAYQEALKASTAYNTVQRILAGSTGNNGMVNMATFDNLLKAETGLSAKQGGMQMLLEHGGFPNQVQGAFGNLTGTGFVPVSQLMQGVQILGHYANGNVEAARRELDQRNALMGRLSHGQYSDIGGGVPTINPMPNVPWLNPGAGVGGGNGNSSAGGPGVGPGLRPNPGAPVQPPQGGAAAIRARARAGQLTNADRVYLQSIAGRQ